MKPLAKKVLLIGWDAADWAIINPLLDSGKMPSLESLVNRGVMGKISTLDPPLSPMLWTSIATGKLADKHGILGFMEPDPEKGGVRPVRGTSRKCKAIWNILHQMGMKVNIIGWWPSHPAEPVNGVMISDMFQKISGTYGEEWKLFSGTVFPEEIATEIPDLRVHPEELTGAHILPFVPKAGNIDQSKDKRLHAIAKNLAEAASVQSVTTWLMENTEWDFTAVYFDSIDHFCHGFMKYHPPQMQGLPDDQFELYQNVVNGAYLFHDMMLGRLIDLAGEDTTIILVSDHGFYTDEKRAKKLPDVPASPALEHNPYGIICLAGNGIKKDERIYGASLLDICPTILTLYGLPVASDMDGKVLINAFNEEMTPEIIDSWETIEGECGMHPEYLKEDPEYSREALQQLIELGYIEDPGADKNKAAEKTIRETKYNLSRVFAFKGKYDEAVAILEEIFNDDQNDIRYHLDLAKYYLELNRLTEAEKIIQKIKALESKFLPDSVFFEGVLLLRKNKHRKAVKIFKELEKINPGNIYINEELGKAYIRLGRYRDALVTFNRVIEKNDSNAYAYAGLGISLLRLDRCEEATQELLAAIGLTFHYPLAHYHLGEAFFRQNKYGEAAIAFENALRMAPGLYKAKQWLIRLYAEFLNQPDKADFYMQQINDKMKGTITIVSGLPRSGTSMMMQMLKAGGLEVLTDHVRKPDEYNPEGYYELDRVKKIAENKDILEKAVGKVIKIIAQLLKYLPDEYHYKVIFMKRNMKEIIRSQQIMLGKDPAVYPVNVAASFEKELERVNIWVEKEPNVDVLFVNYSQVIENPLQQALRISEFLSLLHHPQKMVTVVNENLYRNRE